MSSASESAMATVNNNGDIDDCDEDKTQLGVLVSRVISTTIGSSAGIPDGTVEESFMARNNLSSFLLKQLRTFHLTDVPLEEDDLILLESFFGNHLLRLIQSVIKHCKRGHQEESIWRWIKSLISELHEMLSSSLYLLNKCKIHVLIPLLKTYHTSIDTPFDVRPTAGHSKISIMDLMMDHDYIYECMICMKDFLILLLSYSSLPHEIQLLFDLASDTSGNNLTNQNVIRSTDQDPSATTVINATIKSLSLPSSPKHSVKGSNGSNKTDGGPSSPEKNGTNSNTPKSNKSISPKHNLTGTIGAIPGGAINANETEILNAGDGNNTGAEQIINDVSMVKIGAVDDESDREDLYYSMLPSSLNHDLTSNLPTSMFAFTPYSSLSLPPVKNFPLKSFTFSSYIRLENIVTQSRNQMNNGDASNYSRSVSYDGRGNRDRTGSTSGDVQRMFLFSFKSSTTPPLAYTAYFSFPNCSNNNQSSDGPTSNYLKLTVSCFKGSSSPSLSHTLSFPFPLSSPSMATSGNSLMHLALSFSSSSLSLFINGELMESNNNDWSISSVKSPGPIFDRCFIGCPFSAQAIGAGHGSSNQRSVNNSNDTGFTGQLTSIYIFNSALSLNSVHFLHEIDPSNERPAMKYQCQHQGTGHHSNRVDRSDSVHCNRNNSNLSLNRKEKEKSIKELHSSLVCLYSPNDINWPIALQLISNNQLTSHALIQGNLEIIQRSLITDSIKSLNQGFDVIITLINYFLKNNMFNEYSQLVNFSTSLIGSSGLIGSDRSNIQLYFIESAINSNLFHQLLSGLNSLPDWKKISFITLPSSQLINSLINLVQNLLIVDHGKGSINVTNTFETMISPINANEERSCKLKAEIIRQIMDLFLFNSFLWNLLVPSPTSSKMVSPVKMKQREETVSTLYNFISTNLLNGQDLKHDNNSSDCSSTNYANHLLRRNKRISFMMQIFSSLRIHYYHRNLEEVSGDQVDLGTSTGDRKKLIQEQFNKRERMIAGIRSNCLMFIKSLLSKSSSKSSLAKKDSLASDLIDNDDNDNKRNSSSSNDQESTDHESVNEEFIFDEETNCILNYLSVTSKEIFMKGNPDSKSLLNIIDVLSLLNSLIVELPATMIPSFDSRKGIHVLFQLINDSIIGKQGSNERPNDDEDDNGDKEEREVIRSFCLKILGSFLMRSTIKRKSQAMTSAHFSMLHYMLSQDQDIITHQLYVNLMEITVESPISSIYSLQASHKNKKNARGASASDLEQSNVSASEIVSEPDPFDQIPDLDLLDYAMSQPDEPSKDDGGHQHNQRTSNLKEPGVKIENPSMIKVIAMLVINHKQLSDQFLKDLHTLLLDSRANRRLILQMSVWQSWLISFLKMDYLDCQQSGRSDHEMVGKEKKKRESTVINLFKLLLYHALRWEFGGWRVWIDSLAIIHSFLSKESFNKMYLNYNNNNSNHKSSGHDHRGQEDVETASDLRPKVVPTYRIPSFRWSSIHVQLLDALIGSIIKDINSFRKEALLRSNLANVGVRGVVTGDFPELNPESESFILESLLLSSDIYVINIIHLISQLCDSTILDAGGLLPLLASATSSGSSKSSSSSPTPDKDQDGSSSSDGSNDMMTDGRATELLHQLTFLADYLIFNSFTSLSGVPMTPTGLNVSGGGTSNGVSLAELEAEKNMSSGGLLRQILRLVSMVAVKRVLRLKDKNSAGHSSSTHGQQSNEQHSTLTAQPIIAVKDLELAESNSIKDDEETSSEEVTDDDDDDEDSERAEKARKQFQTLATISSKVPSGNSSSTFNDKCYLPNDEEEEHLLLCVKDIERLRATLYRTDPSSSDTSSNGSKDRTNSNFLALSALYFLSVLLVSKYRDSLESSSLATSGQSKTASSQGPSTSSKKEPDLIHLLENSLYPTIQLLKEIISDFEVFLSKSLLGSKGQVLLTKSLVKRIKSNECSSLELVMLLCSQEFQNSLQKNAGLAFIELINEGRLLSISMKEHIIRVGIEADFILARIESEDKEREVRFKKESVTIENMREKESDLTCTVITELNCLSLSSSNDRMVLSCPGKGRSTSTYSYRDLDEFIKDKKHVLLKEQEYFVQQEIKQQHALKQQQHQDKMIRDATLNNENVSSGNQNKPDDKDRNNSDVVKLMDQIKLLQNKIASVEKERDDAISQLKVEKERSSLQSTPDTSLVLETASRKSESDIGIEAVSKSENNESKVSSLATTSVSMEAVTIPSIIAETGENESSTSNDIED